MFCKLCNKEINSRFYVHINSNHHSNLKKYFEEFPEQGQEYRDSKPKAAWNKGLTASTSESVARYAQKIKEHTNKEEVRKQRSDLMKRRYEQGDILSPKQRQEVVKHGSDGWVAKVKNASADERKIMLKNFTSAGNDAQKIKRPSLTPEDYQRLYKQSKGTFVWSKCSKCNKDIVICIGDRKNPRPKHNFCSKECKIHYRLDNPNTSIGFLRLEHHSPKLQRTVILMSKLELFMATILDESPHVHIWQVCPFYIHYDFDNKTRKYYPDFLINDNLVLEVKSDYVFQLQQDKTIAKLDAATKWCTANNYIFEYWEFGTRNYDLDKIKSDPRVRKFLLGGN